MWKNILELGNKNAEEDFDVVNEDFCLSVCHVILESEFESTADRAHSANRACDFLKGFLFWLRCLPDINSLAGRKEAKEEKGQMESSKVSWICESPTCHCSTVPPLQKLETSQILLKGLFMNIYDFMYFQW